ncbi:MAG: ABC transporter transmembrane domain-containing protein, partial [Caldilineaceae bacterium]|nr:ABC transporter transmembrane domain-containing protein [Caldilineaceae bacterium]
MAVESAVPRPRFYTGPYSTAWRLVGRYGRELKVAIALRFLQSICAGLPVLFLVWVVNRLRQETLTVGDAWLATSVTVGAIVLQFAVWYASNRIAWISTYFATGEARATTLEHIQRLPLGTLRSHTTGNVTATFTTDFELAAQYVSEAMPALLGALGLPLFVVAGLGFMDPSLAVSVAVSLVVAGPLFIWVNNRFKALALLRGDRMAEAGGRILEYVRGIAVARAFNRTDDRMSRFSHAVGTMREINMRLVLRLLPLGMLTIGVVQLGVPVVMASTAYRWFGGAVDAGTALVFLVLIMRVYGPIVALSGHFELLRLGDAALER